MESLLATVGFFFATCALSVAAIFFKGIVNLNLGECVFLAGLPLIFVFKLLGNRPLFLVFLFWIFAPAAGFSIAWNYVTIPIFYYHALWGFGGTVLGIVLLVMLPLHVILFVAIALVRGDAVALLCSFIGNIFFAFAMGCSWGCILRPRFGAGLQKTMKSN